MITAAEHPVVPVRGPRLLVAQCERVGRLDESRPSARERLEATLGADLAALLVAALTRSAPISAPHAPQALV